MIFHLSSCDVTPRRVEAFEINARKQSRKAIRWWVSVLSLTIGLILMILDLSRTHF
jgi:uncharacterized membrane protein